MPSVYQGNSTPKATATWAATTAYTLGQLVTPNPITGQFFTCVVSGTSGSSQPTWSGPSFPTIGTTFTDGGVTWSCGGSNVGKVAPIIQQPVDPDEPISAQTDVPDMTLADFLAWLIPKVGYLAGANTWTALNTFGNGAIFQPWLKTDEILGLNPGDTVNMGSVSGTGNDFVFNGALILKGDPITELGEFALGIAYSVSGDITLPNKCPFFVEELDGSASTINLPASPTSGQVIVVKQLGVGTLTIKASVNIDGTIGSTGVTISSQYGVLRFFFDGTANQWFLF